MAERVITGNDYDRIKFKCQRCRGIFYELTEKFRPVPPMRGDYVRLVDKYGKNGYNWYDFPHTEWTIGDNVACVQCGEPIRIDYVLKETRGAVLASIGRNEAEKFEALQDTPDEKEDVSSDSGGGYVGSNHDMDTVSSSDGGDLAGIYGLVDVDDKVGAEVLRLTSGGLTQVEIAEACGISVYRARKYQTGAI